MPQARWVGNTYVNQYNQAVPQGQEFAYDPSIWNPSFDNLKQQQKQAQGTFSQADATNAEAMGFLRDAATGAAPSAAELQMKAGADQALRNQMAAAASSRSANPAATFRQTQMSGLGATLQNNQAMGAMRAQEMATARGQFADATGQNQQVMQQRAMQLMAMGFDQDTALSMAKQNQAQLLAGMHQAEQEQKNQRLAAGLQFGSSLISSGAQMAPLLKSDMRAKEKIESAEDDSREMLQALAAYSYDYKSKKDGKGRQFGIMAQDLERSKMGKSLVVDTPNGKAVRADKAALAALAALAGVEKRLSKMEAA
jgi:hypothetical protein